VLPFGKCCPLESVALWKVLPFGKCCPLESVALYFAFNSYDIPNALFKVLRFKFRKTKKKASIISYE